MKTYLHCDAPKRIPKSVKRFSETNAREPATPHPRQHRCGGGQDRIRHLQPLGEQSEWLSAAQPAPESKGWTGERYDADAGLQYLNARYYDPLLGMFIQPDWFEVMQPGVGTNRFSYSFNDPVNKFDPGGNGWLKEAFKAVFGGAGIGASRKAGERAFESGMRSLREEAKRSAWRQERELVRAGGGTRNWSPEEVRELLEDGSIKSYEAQHRRNAAAHPEQAGLADNIEFLSVDEHKALHRANGGYRAPTDGPPINRNEMFRQLTGEDLPASTSERVTYEDVIDRTGNVIDIITNSHTMGIIDALDPSTWADWQYQRATGYSFFDTPLERYYRECARGNCT